MRTTGLEACGSVQKALAVAACEVTALPDEDRKQVFMVVDALIRDFKAKKAYAH